MKQDVIKFLNNLPASPVDQFNEALQHYIKAKDANKAIMQYHNIQGYSPQRLSELMYDLKKVYEITVADLAPVSKKATTPKLNDKQPHSRQQYHL